MVGRYESVMVSSITQTEIFIALVVAAHAGVLAVRLCVSLYRACTDVCVERWALAVFVRCVTSGYG